MSTNRITRKDLDGAVKRYADACSHFDMVPEGFHIGLDIGSKTYGRAYRLYVSGDMVRVKGDSGVYRNTYPNGSGHHRPPVGCDFVGMTAREAYDTITDRCSVLWAVMEKQAGRGRTYTP